MSSFTLVPRGPFSLSRAADVLAHIPCLRHQPRSEGGTVRIGFVSDRDHRSVAVVLRTLDDGLVHAAVAGSDRTEEVAEQVARIFSLDHDATEYPRVARRDPKLAGVFDAFEGLRPVCFTSAYECACWAILSQRISSAQAAKIVAELVRAHGETVTVDGVPVGVFPRPDRLLDVSSIPGVAAIKIERLHAIAQAALEGELDAKRLRALGPLAEGRLRELPGIGPFWASAIYLRACGVADVFPDEPVSVAALGALHGLGDRPAPSEVARLVAPYRPFGMWIAFLLRVAAARGVLPGLAGREGAIRRPRGLPRRKLGVSET